MLTKYRLISVALVILLFVYAGSQTRNELRQKYGAPYAEKFFIRPGITLLVAYAEDGQPCELVIEPYRSIFASNSEIMMSSEMASEIIAELVPVSSRGLKGREMTLSSSCNSIIGATYEKVSITQATNLCVKKGENSVSSVNIKWNNRKCQQNSASK